MNTNSALCFLNCVPWSDYPHETERLFYGGYTAMTIIGLSHIPSTVDYSPYIRVISMFTQCIDGMESKNGVKLSNKSGNCCRRLIKKK
eukprot:205002_1